ncbi:MAG: diguanylate cyclase [Rhizobiales bacterium]|nr:diguanylate cyclase [Hyphomicrobiales bacterium]
MGIYTLCAVIVVVFAISNLHVLKVASDVANDVRVEVERDLIRHELDRQVEILAQDQSQISHWDNTVVALSGKIDDDFVNVEIADWLWDDFGIETSIVIGRDGKPLLAVFQDQVLAASEGNSQISQNIDLIETAQQNYMKNRKDTGTGFVAGGHPVRSSNPIYASDIRMFNDQLVVVIAQAIVPDDEQVLPSGLPNVLLTFKPLSKSVFNSIGKKLGLNGFTITGNKTLAEEFSGIDVGMGHSAPALRAIWKTSSPSNTIWNQSVAVLIALLLVVTLSLALIANRYGRTLKELQKSEQKNRFLALHDALTGLPDRLQFDSTLDSIIAEGKQDRCAILCADLDRFKVVNDKFGHHAGDTVLKTVANRIAEAVGDKGMAARIGGDEFIILLHDELDKDSVLFLCDTIIESVCREISFDGGVTNVGASIGVAWWPDDALTAKTIIRSADAAVYRAKENGRGQTFAAADLNSVADKSDGYMAKVQAAE